MVLMCFCPKETDADEAMHVDAVMRLGHGQKFPYTLMRSHTLRTSCLFGSSSGDWLWRISTLLTAGNLSRGTCFSYDTHPRSSENTCCPRCPREAARFLRTQSVLGAWVPPRHHRAAPLTFRGHTRWHIPGPLFLDCFGQGRHGNHPTSTRSDVTAIPFS